ncbi:hypothetical protein ACHAPT_012833 [Fusarium lateritium]
MSDWNHAVKHKYGQYKRKAVGLSEESRQAREPDWQFKVMSNMRRRPRPEKRTDTTARPDQSNTRQVLRCRRKRFNKLIRAINNATVQAVNEIADDNKVKCKIGFADWNPWVSQAVSGQMCDPKSNGDYPDENQPDMQFIKPDTHPWINWRAEVDSQELKRRALEDPEFRENLIAEQKKREMRLEESIWSSSFFNSPNPPTIVRRILNRREPKAPGCPGDNDWDYKMGLASFAMAEAIDLRSLVLDVEVPSCKVDDQFKCYSADGFKAYAQADRPDAHYEDFCKNVKKPEHTKGWSYQKEYARARRITTSKDAAEFSINECIESMKKLIHNCDTKSKMN